MAKNQDKPDIRLVGDRDLPNTKFPAQVSKFRVFLDPEVHSRIQKHAQENRTVEIGGVLVGDWERDADGPFVAVRNVICSQLAASGAGEVTFTHDAWADIHRVMDADYADSKIVGWYHTHPDFGIFLSDRDRFIHEHFFSDPGQIAYVVDPIRQQEGVFVWRHGKTALCQHYWVGNDVRTTPAKPGKPGGDGKTKTADASGQVATEPEPPRGDWLLIMLLGVLFFLIGYLLADRKTAWERQRIVDGVMAHFGNMVHIRPGLRQSLDIVSDELKNQQTNLAKIRPKEPDGKAQLTQAEVDEWSERLRQTRNALARIEDIYCMSELEAAAYAKLFADDFAVQRGGVGQLLSPDSSGKDSSRQASPKTSTVPQPPEKKSDAPTTPLREPAPASSTPTDSKATESE